MQGGSQGGRWVKRVAVAFVTAGLVLLSFVAYQLWGTALYEHHAQDQLRQELSSKLHPTATTTVPSTAPPVSAPATTTTTGAHVAPASPDPSVGSPIGLLSIPRLGMNDTVFVEGTDEHQLQQGPGHYAGTPLPGEAGNAAIAGHRTTYGAPFYDLNNLQPGDPIYVQTPQGHFTYDVTGSQVVDPADVSVLDPSPKPVLTLTTCNPRYSAATRLVVTAELTSAVPAQPPPSASTTTTSSVPPAKVQLPTSLAGGAEASSNALSGLSTRGEVLKAVLWGALTFVTAGLGLVAWRRGRRPWSRVALAMGTPLTVGAILVCFQHVSLALPQSF